MVCVFLLICCCWFGLVWFLFSVVMSGCCLFVFSLSFLCFFAYLYLLCFCFVLHYVCRIFLLPSVSLVCIFFLSSLWIHVQGLEQQPNHIHCKWTIHWIALSSIFVSLIHMFVVLFKRVAVVLICLHNGFVCVCLCLFLCGSTVICARWFAWFCWFWFVCVIVFLFSLFLIF